MGSSPTFGTCESDLASRQAAFFFCIAGDPRTWSLRRLMMGCLTQQRIEAKTPEGAEKFRYSLQIVLWIGELRCRVGAPGTLPQPHSCANRTGFRPFYGDIAWYNSLIRGICFI